MQCAYLVVPFFFIACILAGCTPTEKLTPTLSHAATATLEPTSTLEREKTNLTSPPTPTVQATEGPKPLRIMPLGDSLTEGGYPGFVASYRGFLESMLKEAGYHIDMVGTGWKQAHGGEDRENEGHGGFTIGPDESQLNGGNANLYNHLEEYMRTEPDVILLLIGINDLLPGEGRPVKPEDAPAKLCGLVERIHILRPEAAIFVASLAPVGWTDGKDWPDYQAVNAVAEDLGSKDGGDTTYFVDLNHKLEPEMDKEVDFTDGLHFSQSGAKKVARVWFDALVEAGVLEKK